MDTLTPVVDYIARSKGKTQAQFAETRRLLAAWQDAFRLWQQEPSLANRQLAKQAHEAYKAEQNRAMGAAYEQQRQSLSRLQRATA